RRRRCPSRRSTAAWSAEAQCLRQRGPLSRPIWPRGARGGIIGSVAARPEGANVRMDEQGQTAVAEAKPAAGNEQTAPASVATGSNVAQPAAGNGPTLMLIDGHGLVFRAFHAMRQNLATTKGE